MIIDYRERELIELIESPQIKNLPIADIWVGAFDEGDNPLPGGVLIERKSVADLVASILDGRYREQRTRLLEYTQKTNTSPLYIIEGNLQNAQRIDPDVLQQWLNRLMLRYRVSVINTKDIAHTAKLCKILEKQFLVDGKCFLNEAVKYEETIHVKKKDNNSDPKIFFNAAIQQCPGISSTISQKIYEMYGGFKKLNEASVDDIANIVIGKRKLGKTVATRLKECLI
jgi:ERCC4-type nuclease